MSTPKDRLDALRSAMKEHRIDAWVIPSSDPHESEYAAAHWSGRSWLSGFSGSAGTVVVTDEQAALWTDGRYFLQAEEQLSGSTIQLMREGEPDVPSVQQWLADTLSAGQTVGFDGKVVPLTRVRSLLKTLTPVGVQLNTDHDLLQQSWKERPAIPASKVVLHSDGLAGRTREEKLADVRAVLAEKGADQVLVTTLDDIAWLFNLRGSDVEFNPVFLAYALISADSVQLFINSDRLDGEAAAALDASKVERLPYETVSERLKGLAETALLIDPDTTSQWLVEALPEHVAVVESAIPSRRLKSIKNSVEIERMSNCHRRDGAAMVRFMRWLDENVPGGEVTELDLDRKLLELRSADSLFQGPSFSTIGGYAEHGAIIHYRADEDSCFTIQPKGLLLVDSGGQYLDGTTDITRTFACGEMTDEEMTDYTLVLKCHIRLASTRFLKGTRGLQLDTVTRQPLWAEGLNYGHGTGHGVGYFLNVHEGPQSVSPKWLNVPLEPGMLVTNEPGMYRNGCHGVRIENIMLVEEDITTEFGQFYRLKSLTLAPIDTRPLKRELLTADEIDWLNAYHRHVCSELSQLLDGEDELWLRQATQAY